VTWRFSGLSSSVAIQCAIGALSSFRELGEMSPHTRLCPATITVYPVGLKRVWGRSMAISPNQTSGSEQLPGCPSIEILVTLGSRIAPHLMIRGDCCGLRRIPEFGGDGGTHDQSTFQDLPKWGKGAEEPLTLDRQQHVRPGGAERGGEEFADANHCHASGSRLGHHQP